MERDDAKRSDEEIKLEKEANDSELTDQELENVTGGKGGKPIQQLPPVSP
jgi:bacteriocin-like protein